MLVLPDVEVKEKWNVDERAIIVDLIMRTEIEYLQSKKIQIASN